MLKNCLLFMNLHTSRPNNTKIPMIDCHITKKIKVASLVPSNCSSTFRAPVMEAEILRDKRTHIFCKPKSHGKLSPTLLVIDMVDQYLQLDSHM